VKVRAIEQQNAAFKLVEFPIAGVVGNRALAGGTEL
jgi:hypothetical protein